MGCITLVRGDCMDYMPSMPENCFGLAVADPLLGIDYRAGRCEPPAERYFTELFRVSRDQIVFGGNRFGLPPTRGIVCWDRMYRGETGPQWEMAWTSFDKPPKVFKYVSRGRDANGVKQKPEALYRWLLKTYARCDGPVLDTHGGSVNLGRAALALGVELTVFVREPECFEKMCGSLAGAYGKIWVREDSVEQER